MTLNRPRPLALFLFLACFGTTLALGTWQVQRLAWKTNLIAEIEAAKVSAPLTSIPADADELKARAFYPVTVSGTWLGDTEFHLSPRFYKGKLGYFVITPFLLEDGRTLLVNRGWIPAAQKEAASRPESRVKGKATIHGLIRLGDERNYLTPHNQPEKNLWFGRDIAQMAATSDPSSRALARRSTLAPSKKDGLPRQPQESPRNDVANEEELKQTRLKNTIPAMVDIVGTQDIKTLPVPSDGTIRLTNDHLSYIITWYGIALGILVIFILTLRKRNPSPQK